MPWVNVISINLHHGASAASNKDSNVHESTCLEYTVTPDGTLMEVVSDQSIDEISDLEPHSSVAIQSVGLSLLQEAGTSKRGVDEVTDSGYSGSKSSRCSSPPSRTTSPSPLKKKRSESPKPSSSNHLASYQAKNYIEELDLREYLTTFSFKSKAALENYDQLGTLLGNDRTAIVDAIVNAILKINYIPAQSELIAAAKKICELFTCEEEGTYYNPADEWHRNAYGKLPDRVKNLKYKLREKQAGSLKRSLACTTTAGPSSGSKYTSPAQLQGSTDKNDASLASAIWRLKHESTENINNLLESWSLTHALRNACLRREGTASSASSSESKDENNASVHDYYNEWTSLTLPIGYLLLNQDFEELYPGLESGLESKWDTSKALIIDLLEKEVPRSDTYSRSLLRDYAAAPEDNRDAIFLHLLPTLCWQRQRKKGSQEVATVAEVRKSFILHVLIPGDINRILDEHRSYLQRQGLRLQPILIVVGPTLQSISASYVQVDKIKYKLKTPVKALDTCFKAFFALDAAYPSNSECVWYFIQKYFYEMHIKGDRNLPRVTSVIASLRGLASKKKI